MAWSSSRLRATKFSRTNSQGEYMGKKRESALAAAIACGLTCPLQAGEKLQFSSIVFGTSATETRLELGGSNVYAVFSSDELVISVDIPNSHPLQNLSGKCTGVADKVGGNLKAGGYCTYSNPTGGKFVLNYVVDPSLKPEWAGTFEMTGIEGNATGWKARCKWKPPVDYPGQRYVSRWSCSAEKP
jgi:hypothetical protein